MPELMSVVVLFKEPVEGGLKEMLTYDFTTWGKKEQ